MTRRRLGLFLTLFGLTTLSACGVPLVPIV